MELIKNNIHMNVLKKNMVTTFYVNHEGTVNESCPAMKSVICHKEKALVEQVYVRNNQLVVEGNVGYEILYYPEEGESVYGLEGESMFRETLKIPEVEEADARVTLEVISASVKLIDGRNYLYKISVMAYITVEQLNDFQSTRVVPDEETMVMDKEIELLETVVNKTEMFRINEVVEIPAGKPAVETIVWKDIRISSLESKILNRQMELNGELSVFILYLPDVESGTEQWYETSLPFHGIVEMEEADEGLISYVDGMLHTVNLSVEMNQDNEMKQLNLSALIRLDTKLYEEQKCRTVVDLYSPKKEIIPEFEEQKYYQLLVKNQARTKETIKIDIDETKGRILQLCQGTARLQIENVIAGDNGIKIMGKLIGEIIYVSSEDRNSICGQTKEVPFEHLIDAEGITTKDQYYIDWRTEQITSNMINGKQVEIKSVVAMEVIVFREIKERMIQKIREEELTVEEIGNLPLLKGYVVQQGDTLWQLAKKNRTTMEAIKAVNGLQDETLRKGEKLLIVKSCQ